MSKKITKNIFFLLSIAIFSFLLIVNDNVHAFTKEEQATIDKITLEQELQKQKLEQIKNSEIIESESAKNLLTAIELKKDVADEKEQAYDKAINQSKTIIIIFGILSLLILAGLGVWQDMKLADKKKELQEDFDKNSEKLQKEASREVELIKKENQLIIRDQQAELRKHYKEDFDQQLKYVYDEINELRKNIKQGAGENVPTDFGTTDNSKSNLEPSFD